MHKTIRPASKFENIIVEKGGYYGRNYVFWENQFQKGGAKCKMKIKIEKIRRNAINDSSETLEEKTYKVVRNKTVLHLQT
jgi:hypothetical protein